MSWDTTVLPQSLAQATGAQACGAKLGLPALGGAVVDARRERIQDSPNFDGTRFLNAIETPQGVKEIGSVAKEFISGKQQREPKAAHPIFMPPKGSLVPGKGEDLRVTWLGHSSTLLEIDGHLVLTDPVFGPRAAPVSWMGPKRFHPAPVAAEDLPPLDVILISHDHYDHLDYPTIMKLAARKTQWVTTMGVGAHLEAWGVPAERITELDWWQAAQFKGLNITATPSRHFQGRGPSAAAETFWASWAIQGPKSSAWFSGDTGPWDDGFAEIGERFGGFDLTMIEIGAWHPSWGNIHLGPDNAARVHELVKGKTMMPVHWGTFSLAMHAWDQPIQRLTELAEQRSIQLLSPMMGETVHRESGVSKYWLEHD